MAPRTITITITGDAQQMARVMRWPSWRRRVWLVWRRFQRFVGVA